MEVSVESISTVEQKLTVGVPATQVDTKVNAKVKETQKQARIAGFRPGKVPEREIRRRFGESIRQEVLGEVIQEAYFNALQKAEVNPIDNPKIDVKVNEAGKDLQFEAVIEVLPQIELPDLTQIAIERVTTDIVDGDLDKMIEKIREQSADWAEKQEAAEEGDRLTLDYAGTIDGEAFEGGTATEQSLVLGSNSMIPGFEDQLIGVKAGEERLLKVNFPDDYHAEALKGKAAEFATTTHKIESKQLPELDEALFAQYGVKEGGEEAFRKEVLGNMERQKKQLEHQIFANHAAIELVKQSDFVVPKALVEREARNQRDNALRQIFGQIPEQIKKNPDLLPFTSFMSKAEHNVRSGLILMELIKQQKIEVDAERLEVKLDEICEAYEDPAQMKSSIKGNRNQLEGVEQQLLEELVMEYLAGQASVTDTKLSFMELTEYKMKEPVAENEETDQAEASADLA